MINNIIIIGEQPINKFFILSNLLDHQLLPKQEFLLEVIPLPIEIKLGNYDTKIIYKNDEFILDKKNILSKIHSIIKPLKNNHIYFEPITIQFNSPYSINYYILPSYEIDNNTNNLLDMKILSLYDKYLQLDNLLLINIIPTNCINLLKSCTNVMVDYLNKNKIILIFIYDRDNLDLSIESIDLIEYKNVYYIKKSDFYITDSNKYIKKILSENLINLNINNEKNYLSDNYYLDDKLQSEINLLDLNFNLNIIKKILNKLYLSLNNYEIDNSFTNYYDFLYYIYISNEYRHIHYYKTLKYSNNFKSSDDHDILNNNIDNIENMEQMYKLLKYNFNIKNFELIDEFKDYKNLIEYAIDLFDITFNYYIKKLEPEILRYYVTLYHNRNYTEEFESTEDCKFTLMIKGLRKMCIALIKNKFSYYS